MPAIVPLIHIDTLELGASLLKKAGLFSKEPGHRLLRIRGTAKGTDESDDRFGAYPAAQKWVELGNMRSEIARRAEALMPPGIEFGRISFEMLDPGATLDWRRETSPYFDRWTRAILPIRTGPGTLLVYGNEPASPGQGWFTIVSPRLPHCAVNMGEHPWVWLTLDFRKRETTE